MKTNYFILVGTIILALAIIYSGNNIADSINSSEQKMQTGLLSEEEAAQYLGMSHQQLWNILNEDEINKKNNSGADLKTFIPYIKLKEVKYFSTHQLNEWIEYKFKISSTLK